MNKEQYELSLDVIRERLSKIQDSIPLSDAIVLYQSDLIEQQRKEIDDLKVTIAQLIEVMNDAISMRTEINEQYFLDRLGLERGKIDD